MIFGIEDAGTLFPSYQVGGQVLDPPTSAADPQLSTQINRNLPRLSMPVDLLQLYKTTGLALRSCFHFED
jgi:hypothetical protein